MEPRSPKFITMATVVMEIGSEYFSCLQGPMAHLHAKDRAINNKDKIMSQIYDLIVIDRIHMGTEQDNYRLLSRLRTLSHRKKREKYFA